MKDMTEPLTVYYEGEPVFMLNPVLVKERNLSKNRIHLIKFLHVGVLNIEKEMSQTDDPTELKRLFTDWTSHQFRLQSAWGFDQNQNYHRFWWVPKCTCPKIDNEDNHPRGYYVFNQKCLVHGK